MKTTKLIMLMIIGMITLNSCSNDEPIMNTTPITEVSQPYYHIPEWAHGNYYFGSDPAEYIVSETNIDSQFGPDINEEITAYIQENGAQSVDIVEVNEGYRYRLIVSYLMNDKEPETFEFYDTVIPYMHHFIGGQLVKTYYSE